MLCDAGTTAVLWARSATVANSITTSQENPGYLPEISLPPSLTATTDPAVALDSADLVVFAVPAQTLRSCLTTWRHRVEMPITEVVAAVIADKLPVRDAAAVLASRSAKPEWYGA